jgi:outer membrane protein assembly factor BamA
MMRRFPRIVRLIATAGVLAATAQSQTGSRLEEIAAEQEQKASQIKPEQQGKLERAMLEFRERNLLQRFSNGLAGFHLKLGGMGAGTGFGIGPEYRRTGLLGGPLNFRASAQTSFRGDRKFDLELAAPQLSGGKYFATFYAVHHDYPRMNYYGPGPDSEKTGRTNYRLEDTAMDATFGIRPVKRLTLASSAGYVLNNVGHGTDPRFASTETVYSPSQAAGMDKQANFLRTGAYAQYDWRDNPDGPRRGGSYFAQFSDYRDRSLGLSNFRRLDMEAQQYISVLNSRRVFAVRTKSVLTYSNAAALPFYMQPSLGGAEDLRGYRPYRFRGDNLIVMNGEYRWEVFSGLDMAVFADAGQVFMRKSDLAWDRMESDVGFGFRFNQRDRTFLRLDVGFSHEGFQVWVKFNNIFKKGPVHTSSNMGDI